MDLLLVTVDEVVKATNQTIVEKLKKDNDGKLTKEEAEDVFNAVKVEVLETLTKEGKEVLDKVVADVPALINILIESAVSRNK